jgi:hypothetical protein
MRLLEKLLNDDLVLNSDKLDESVMGGNLNWGEIRSAYKSIFREFESKGYLLGNALITLWIILKWILKNRM